MSENQRVSVKFILEIVGLLVILVTITASWKTNEITGKYNAEEIKKHIIEDDTREVVLKSSLHNIEIKQVEVIKDISYQQSSIDELKKDTEQIKDMIIERIQ